MLTQNKQASLYSILYDKIPENHTLKRINEAIDFSFINDLLEDSYSKYYGRPAKEPELMVKLLVLQYLYDLSDERLIEEASLNLAYLYFLGINPEDELPDPSLLSKFRVHRLGDSLLDEILETINRQCVEKGIIKCSGLTIDTTHTRAHTFQATPERVMKRLAKKIYRNLDEENGSIPEELDQDIPNYKEIEDHREAKQTMKSHLEKTMKQVEEAVELKNHPKTKSVIENAKEILEDPKFLQSKGVRSIVDQEARVGHKSKTKRFFGYKTEYMMTTEERIITAVHVENGAYVDGKAFDELLDKTKKCGLTIKEFFGDKAYFRKPILESIESLGAIPYIPVSEMAYKIDEDRFSYNKDSDEWFCDQGNKTIRKDHKVRKCGKQSLKYYFERETCRSCPLRNECITANTVAKIMEVGVNTPALYSYSQRQKSDEFKEKYRKRACQEWKNGEMKNFHGLDCARWYSRLSMSKQAKLTAIAVNLKRIGKILSSNKGKYNTHFTILLNYSMSKPLSRN
ncbi:transposase [Pontibacillus chungwhensis BH030062]|uniref:Transposase n=1 Tax=Pontibacillus chungwhensis BH030062 TaxID=1385513 RepID=A0A0A2UT32_9BACI|nr:transposase [Pontibacillus chungwhensis BH030062]